MKKFTVFALIAVMLFCILPFGCFAEEGENVVFIKDGGRGDGSSPENAAGSILEGYIYLDTERDGTIVICGPTTTRVFSWGYPHNGTITITSVYGGVDYRKTAGAVLKTKEGIRFTIWGDTVFDNMEMRFGGEYFLVIARYNSITIGKGVKMVPHEKMTGSSVGTSFSIVGGYQEGAPSSPAISDKDSHITVLAGEKITIVAYNRAITDSVSKNAYITVGGNAKVTTLYVTGVNKPNCVYGDITVNIKDNAQIRALCASGDGGCKANSLTVNLMGGFVKAITTHNNGAHSGTEIKNVLTSYERGTTLNVQRGVLNAKERAELENVFDKLNVVSNWVTETEPAGTEPAETEAVTASAPQTEPVTEPSPTVSADIMVPLVPAETAAPQTGFPQEEAQDKSAGTAVWIIAGAVAAAAVCAVFVVIKKKK